MEVKAVRIMGLRFVQNFSKHHAVQYRQGSREQSKKGLFGSVPTQKISTAPSSQLQPVSNTVSDIRKLRI